MYKLYYAPGSASLAVHWMLIELGVPFELAAVDLKAGEQHLPPYLALNPAGRVPTLMVDGEPYAECAALLMLLAERHPGAGFSPAPGSPERPAYLQWMVYFANSLLPAFRRWFYAGEGPAELVEPTKAEVGPIIAGVWDRMDAELSDGRAYLLGERMTAADFLLTMLTRWSRNMERPATAWPHLGAYVSRMKARPGLIEVHAREGLTEWI